MSAGSLFHSAMSSRSAGVGISPAGAYTREGCGRSSLLTLGVPAVVFLKAFTVAATAVMMTMMLRTTKMMDSQPWIMVLRTTASMAAVVLAVPKEVFPSARALLKAALLAKYPTAGTEEKILWMLAVMVTTAVKASGTATIHRYLKEPRLA